MGGSFILFHIFLCLCSGGPLHHRVFSVLFLDLISINKKMCLVLLIAGLVIENRRMGLVIENRRMSGLLDELMFSHGRMSCLQMQWFQQVLPTQHALLVWFFLFLLVSPFCFDIIFEILSVHL